MGVELLKVPAELAPSGNPMNFKVRAGNHTVQGHKLSAQIYIETVPDSGTFKALPLMNLDPDDTGIADLDVSTILHRRMNVDLPAFESGNVTRLLHATLRYRIIFTEEYNKTISSKETSIFTCIRCRLNYYNYPDETLRDYVVQGKKYLTHTQNTIDTIPGSIHYLVLLALQPDTYIAKIKATYTDGYTTENTIGTFSSVTKYNVYAIPAGPRHRDLAIPGKKLLNYTIWVENETGEIVFRKVTFNLLPFHPDKRCFVFSNLMGGIETLITESVSDSLKVERETFLNYLPVEYIASDRNITTSVNDYSNIFEANSGYITRRTVETCKELAISENVFLVGKRSFIAINVDKGSFDIANTREDLYAFKFKYTPAFAKDLILLSSGATESYSDNDYSEDYE